MRCFKADYVFPVSSPPIRNGMVITEDDGSIIEVGEGLNLLPEYRNISVEVKKGLMVPGFVNTHCHLELSGMKGLITQHTRMTGFIAEFVRKRSLGTDTDRDEDIGKAEEEMIRGGIVAVGDISNGKSSFPFKSKRKLYYHTFIEAFDLHPLKAGESFKQSLELREKLLVTCPGSENQVSIVAHAPYTVSPELHHLVTEFGRKEDSILSIHSQESTAEDQLFKEGTGPLMEMYTRMNLDYSWFHKTGKSSLHSTLPFYEGLDKLLLVHNTYTSEEDLIWASALKSPKLYWATCPRANLFIEGCLPNYPLFLKHKLRMTIGTDSLASNTGLSILEEIKSISRAMPDISLEILIQWATLNGATYLGIEDQFGSLQKGKKPGLVWIEGSSGLTLTERSRSTRLI
jgi:cytosine/adenosine deaminase-related metal-dependent hydrolase